MHLLSSVQLYATEDIVTIALCLALLPCVAILLCGVCSIPCEGFTLRSLREKHAWGVSNWRPFRVFRNTFSIHEYSLDAFRVHLAATEILVGADNLYHAASLYSDEGALHRMGADFMRQGYMMSMYMFSGAPWFAQVLLLIQIVVSCGLLCGVRIRTCSCILFLLRASLLNRNPCCAMFGDVFLHHLHFFSLFLPLGNSYSVERALNDHHHKVRLNSSKRDPVKVFTVPSFAIICQYMVFYFIAGNEKWKNPCWSTSFNGVQLILSSHWHATRAGTSLLAHLPATLLNSVSLWLPVLEMSVPALLVFTSGSEALRLTLLTVLLLYHTIARATVDIGLESLQVVSGLWLLIPSETWASLRLRFQRSQSLRIVLLGHSHVYHKLAYIVHHFLCLNPPEEFNENIQAYSQSKGRALTDEEAEAERKAFQTQISTELCNSEHLIEILVCEDTHAWAGAIGAAHLLGGSPCPGSVSFWVSLVRACGLQDKYVYLSAAPKVSSRAVRFLLNPDLTLPKFGIFTKAILLALCVWMLTAQVRDPSPGILPNAQLVAGERHVLNGALEAVFLNHPVRLYDNPETFPRSWPVLSGNKVGGDKEDLLTHLVSPPQFFTPGEFVRMFYNVRYRRVVDCILPTALKDHWALFVCRTVNAKRVWNDKVQNFTVSMAWPDGSTAQIGEFKCFEVQL